MNKRKIIAVLAVCIVLAFSACISKRTLEDAPIITSATYQHTLYNGRGQSIEANASKEGAPPPIITYFRSEENLHADSNGSTEPPVEVGDYYVRIRRPAGNGYRVGNDITVEYHIQKALVTIRAEERQEFIYDGNSKAVVFSIDQNIESSVAYYRSSSDQPMNEPPVERGIYTVIISYDGDAHHMGALKRVELVVR